jgi:hypothetical protein
LDGPIPRRNPIISNHLFWTFLVATIVLIEFDDSYLRDATAPLMPRGSRPEDPGPYLRFLLKCEDTALER